MAEWAMCLHDVTLSGWVQRGPHTRAEAGTGQRCGHRTRPATPACTRGDLPSSHFFLPEPPKPSEVIQVGVFPDLAWLTFSPASIRLPKLHRLFLETAHSHLCAFADAGPLPTVSPTTFSCTPFPWESAWASLLVGHVLPHPPRCHSSQ